MSGVLQIAIHVDQNQLTDKRANRICTKKNLSPRLYTHLHTDKTIFIQVRLLSNNHRIPKTILQLFY